MAENENTEIKETKLKEKDVISLDVYPDWKGKRLPKPRKYAVQAKPTKKQIEDGEGYDPILTNYRMEASWPVPSNDKEAEMLFGKGCTMQSLAVAGVLQKSYADDTPLAEAIVKELRAGWDPATESDPSRFAEIAQKEMSTPPAPKTEKVKAIKKNKAIADSNTILCERLGIEPMRDGESPEAFNDRLMAAVIADAKKVKDKTKK